MKQRVVSAVCGMFLLCFGLGAEAAWNSGKDQEGLPYTFTINDSGNMFGQWCSKEAEACYWMLASQRTCEPGIEIPSVINTEGGAVAISLKCLSSTVIAGKLYYRLVMSPFETVRSALQGQARIAIATPMQDVSFTVMRFDTTGVDAALSRMDTAKRIYFETESKKSTKDQRL